MSKIINPDEYAGNIVMTRIRLARNLKGYRFKVDNVSVAKDIVKKVNRALVRSDTFNLHYVSNLSPLQAEAMKERHLIIKNLVENVKCGAVLINQDESISVMINEEDHLREQCFMKGLRLTEAYQRLDKIDDDIAKNVDIALKFVGELQERCEQLINFPNSGAFPKDRILKSNGYRFLPHKEYLICYTVDEDTKTVYVSAFFNAKKDYLRVLNKLV